MPDVNQALESNSNSARLQFPAKFDAEGGQWMMFTRYKYGRPDKNSPPKENKVGNIVALPIPNNLRNSYGAQWDNTSLGMFGKNLYAGMGNAIRQGANAASYSETAGVGAGVSKIIDTIKAAAIDRFNSGKVLSDLGGLAGDFGTDVVAGSEMFEKAGVYSGLARNPFNAVIYTGPTFRTFNFQWKLIPKSRAEAESIKNIVKEFKVAMHPSFTTAFQDNIFEYPDIFSIQMANSQHTFKIAQCALKDMEIDYASEGGVPKYFEDNIPFVVTLSLQFQELVVLTREDVDTTGGF